MAKTLTKSTKPKRPNYRMTPVRNTKSGETEYYMLWVDGDLTDDDLSRLREQTRTARRAAAKRAESARQYALRRGVIERPTPTRGLSQDEFDKALAKLLGRR